jgi:hypothetical protein
MTETKKHLRLREINSWKECSDCKSKVKITLDRNGFGKCPFCEKVLYTIK